MFEKFSRSWALAGRCWDVLREEPVLLCFPLMSAAALAVILLTFLVPLIAYSGLLSGGVMVLTTGTQRPSFYAALFVVYAVCYTVIVFFNAALVSVAIRRLEGEPVTLSEGLGAALGNLPAIVGYALIAATVGTVLRVVEDRAETVGRLVAGLLGTAWSLASAMVVPVLVAEGAGPLEAISRSASLLRRNWGENVIGNVSIGLVVCLVALPFILIPMAIIIGSAGTPAMVPGLVLFGLAVVFIELVSSTLHTIYTAALYRFATGERDGSAIAAADLKAAFSAR
jgi:Family of unknown function (DUF6159)